MFRQFAVPIFGFDGTQFVLCIVEVSMPIGIQASWSYTLLEWSCKTKHTKHTKHVLTSLVLVCGRTLTLPHAGGAAWRRRQRRLRAHWRHEQLTLQMLLATYDHHAAPRGQTTARSGAGRELYYTAKILSMPSPQRRLARSTSR